MIRMQFVLDTMYVEAGFRQCIEEEKKMILILETKLESKIQYMDDFYEKKPDELSSVNKNQSAIYSVTRFCL